MALLDTTVFIDFGGRRGKKQQQHAEDAIQQLLASGEAFFISRINIAELYVGIELSNDPVAEAAAIEDYLNWITVLEFDDNAAREFARLRADLQKRGRLVGDMDILIAAVAFANGQSLLTRNAAHFSHMTGLTVISYGSTT